MKKYFSKILLFGEYGIINNSNALAIPYDEYSGVIMFRDNDSSSNITMQKLYQYMVRKKLDNLFDIYSFQKNLKEGMIFKSNIPVNYGLGSSGALVAALYDSYSLNKNKINLSETIKELSSIESFFHGKSSGLDPLTSYLNSPILFNANKSIKKIDKTLISNGHDNKGFFLIDTHISSKTQPLVNFFLNKLNDASFKKSFENNFIKSTNNCIDFFLKNDSINLFSEMKSLSASTLNLFNRMIPKSFKNLWLFCLDSKDVALKLCGSGGGGYIIGYSIDLKKTKKELVNYNIKSINFE
ncbi:MAG: mevalonate kinase [Flavobacteriaceae bacterium]|nr:mevalonate kinase [Flavobacteriaceae bacterium]|tara:strand:- start:1551 stop:2441 length:891 start_codon:yes stop_codon:yes gene_type:complete